MPKTIINNKKIHIIQTFYSLWIFDTILSIANVAFNDYYCTYIEPYCDNLSSLWLLMIMDTSRLIKPRCCMAMTSLSKTLQTFSWVKKGMDAAIDSEGPAIHVLYEPILSSLVSLKKRGIKIRFVTEVIPYNIPYCKKLTEIGELRHLDGIRTNFGIADGKQILLHGVSKEKDPLSQAILTSVQGLVEAQQYMFENLWNKAIPEIQKIKEIVEGIKPDVIETVTDPAKIQSLYLDLLRSTTKEIMLIIPTVNTMNHQTDVGVFALLKEIVQDHNDNNNKNIDIRILAPLQKNNEHHNMNLFQQQEKEHNNLLSSYLFSSNPIQFRNMETDSTTKYIIAIIDESLVMEIRDDTRNTFADSMGFATYSNSRATVLSYVSIFESSWKQSELGKKLKESEELQKDFVHIAAHELKNPIQPILGLSSLLMKTTPTDEKEYQNIIKIINRNAKKLIQLTNDILDVTKIETNNLNLQMEIFNLDDLISDIVEDYNNELYNENIKLEYEFLFSKRTDDNYKYQVTGEKILKKEINPIYILADRTRITQVLTNLLNNAIKFISTYGIIKIIVEAEAKYDDGKRVHIKVKDTGSGIDSSIIHHLFSKFTTKSKGGTGLGLYISKRIIESHSGSICANNNENEKGTNIFIPPSISRVITFYIKYNGYSK
jgi:signal transduction histidine kinase